MQPEGPDLIGPPAEPRAADPIVPVASTPRGWLRVVAYVAGAKIALAPLAYALSFGTDGGPGPIYMAHVLAWSSAAALLLANRGDRRAVALGSGFLVVGAMFADPLIRHHVGSALPMASHLAHFVTAVCVDALLPATTWLFVRDFPTLARPRGDRFADLAIRASLAIGGLLVVANLGLLVAGPWLSTAARQSLLVACFDRNSSWPGDALGGYWTAIFVLLLPVYPFALWKARFARQDERRRVWRMLLAAAIGTLPMLLIFLLAEVVPVLGQALLQPGPRQAVVWASHALLLSIPFTTSYAVLVDRTLEVRLVLRLALRYALTRYTLIAACLTPLALLAGFLYVSRDSTLAELFSAGGGAIVVSLAGAAGIALNARGRLLEALDRRFFREQYDARMILAKLVESSRVAESSGALARLVEHEADRALHLESVALFALDPSRERFSCPDRELPALDARSALASLLEGSTEPFDVDLEDPRSVLRRLPEAERHWLADAAVRLIVPLHGSLRQLVGLLALGGRRSEQPFLPEDLLLLKAVAGSIALPIENRLARESPAVPAAPGAPAVHAVDEARASDCLVCGTVHAGNALTCSDCGNGLQSSMLPHVLLGKFRLERRIGAGGMGVVYLAVDLSLQRLVAIKTLPRIAPEYASRLRREARAAAAVLHPNLATIFGAETWHGTPALVFEYLSGGTLADRLHERPLSSGEALELGIAISAALERAHAVRILHRDIKPSNIGFAGDGTPKLLDFGLAHIFDDWRAGLTPRSAGQIWPLDRVSTAQLLETLDMSANARLTPTGVLMGTLAYLSPEAIDGESPRPSFDLWAAALVLYEAITGENPLIGSDARQTLYRIGAADVPDARELEPSCPAELAALLRRALSADARARPASATDLRRELEAIRSRLAG